jgi:signal transduction histidine kinase
MPDGHKDHGIDPQWCLKICRQLVIKVENIGLASESDVMRTLIEIAPVGVVRTDAIGKVVNVNREWRRTFGGNITGRNILTLSSVKRVGLDRPWRQALKGRPTEWVAASFRSVFGKYVVVTIKCAPIAGSRGKGVAGLLFCCWDLTEFTERREAQFTREQARSLGDLAAGAVHELKSPAKAAEYATAAFAEGLGEVLRRYRRVCELQLVPDVLGKVNGAVRSLVKVASAREGVLPLPSADAVRAATRLAEGHGLRCSPEQVRDLAAVGLATELDELLNVKGTQATRSLFGFLTSLSRTVIACSDAKNAISQIDGVARALKAHGFIAPGRPQWTDIREPLDAALVVFRRSFDRADVTCRVRCSRRVPLIHCVPGALVQALSSIFQNCVDAICKVRRRGRVDVSIRKSHNSVVVMIDNNGKPLPATTDPTELGTTLPPLSEGRVRGYGCWVVRETIAVMHKGRVGMQRLRGGSGTRVQFVLPIDPFASGGAKQQK